MYSKIRKFLVFPLFLLRIMLSHAHEIRLIERESEKNLLRGKHANVSIILIGPETVFIFYNKILQTQFEETKTSSWGKRKRRGRRRKTEKKKNATTTTINAHKMINNECKSLHLLPYK